MLLLVNLGVTAFVVFVLRWKSQIGTLLIKQLGLLELTWICFLLMMGLYYVFSTLEIKNSNQPFTDAASTDVMRTFYILGVFMLIHVVIVGTIINRLITARLKLKQKRER